MFQRVIKRMEDRMYKFYLFTVGFSLFTLLISVIFYIYKIATNTTHLFYLIAYSIFLTLALIGGALQIIFFKKRGEDKQIRKAKTKQYRSIKRGLKYVKYVVRLATIVVGIVELISFGGTTFKITFFVITTYLFIQEMLFNIALDILRYRINQFKKDFKSKHPFMFAKKDVDSTEIIDIED